VFREAYRVLKPGGRLAISDVVATAEQPADIRNDLALYSACAAGAACISDLERLLAEAGFAEIKIAPIGRDACQSLLVSQSGVVGHRSSG
jgi:arsenite methyltransferase